MERRTFLAISGAALTAPLLTTTPAAATTPRAPSSGLVVTPAITDAVAVTVDAVRHLDDAEGGNTSTLRHAHRRFTFVADYIRAGRFTDTATRTRAISLWAQLARTLGWMAMDAGLHGLAQRYYRTGLTAAHETGDHALTSHLHGCLTYQAITRGHLGDAADLANAAITAAQGAPPAVRAVAAARHAHALAALGDIHGMRRSTEDAHRHLAHPAAASTRPPWLYWLTDLNVVTGQTLITAAFAGTTGAARAGIRPCARLRVAGWAACRGISRCRGPRAGARRVRVCSRVCRHPVSPRGGSTWVNGRWWWRAVRLVPGAGTWSRGGGEGEVDDDPLAACGGVRDDLGRPAGFSYQGVDQEQSASAQGVGGRQGSWPERVGVRDGQHQYRLFRDGERNRGGGGEHGRVPHDVGHQLADDQAGGVRDLFGHAPARKDFGGFAAGRRDVLGCGEHLEVVVRRRGGHAQLTFPRAGGPPRTSLKVRASARGGVHGGEPASSGRFGAGRSGRNPAEDAPG
jgi:hypothetical protein